MKSPVWGDDRGGVIRGIRRIREVLPRLVRRSGIGAAGQPAGWQTRHAFGAPVAEGVYEALSATCAGTLSMDGAL